MLLRYSRPLASLFIGVLLSSCSAASDITAFEPLVNAAPVAVSLQSAADIPLSGLPRLNFSATAAEVNVLWEVESRSCIIAEASASRAGNVVEIQLHRGGDPAANCVVARVGYRYAMRVAGLEQGRYEVRLVDVFAAQPVVAVGRDSVVVGAVYVVD
ncbi:MAG: hypothetical protein ABIT20_11580 [Gemmatimonadaceae bacterium]